MLINSANLTTLFVGFNTAFNEGSASIESHYKKVAFTVPSSSSEEVYGWLNQFPSMREWVGDRHIKNLSSSGFKIKNKKWETTFAVQRTDVEDDKIGMLSPLFTEMGRAAADHPDELTFSLLKAGFVTNCYDDQFFFDSDHPVGPTDGVRTTASNMQAGAGPAWFLLDTSRAIKPMVFQERLPYQFQALDGTTEPNVFMKDEFLYGVRARVNVGFGLWQLAFGSKATLDNTNYEAARAAMMTFTGDEGRPLGIRPDTLVVPPSLEGAALRLLNTEVGAAGASNEWKNTAKIIVTPWVA